MDHKYSEACTCDSCLDVTYLRVSLPTSREEAFLAAVLAGLPKARAKHPTCGLEGVTGEFAEVVVAVKAEGQERIWLECVDLAVTACRLAIEGAKR